MKETAWIDDDSHMPVWAQRLPDGMTMGAVRRMREAAGCEVGGFRERFEEDVPEEECRLPDVCDKRFAHARAAAYLRDMFEVEARPEQRWALGLASEVLMYARDA